MVAGWLALFTLIAFYLFIIALVNFFKADTCYSCGARISKKEPVRIIGGQTYCVTCNDLLHRKTGK